MKIFKTAYCEKTAKIRLYVLSIVLLAIFIPSPYFLTAEEKMAVERVRAMHASLWEWVNSPAVREKAAQWAKKSGWEDFSPAQVDPGKSGLIGVEWSEITTTLGPLAVKQTAADPVWAARILRWFDKVGLVRGDRFMILASGSFPGFLVSALAAAEVRGLQVYLAVSLGSSTWGANRPESPWPLLELRLRRAGLLQTRSRFYTPGGRGETGENYSSDAAAILKNAAEAAGVPLLNPGNLDNVILMKTVKLTAFRPKLLALIGGSASVTGDSDTLLPPGLIINPSELEEMGSGVARAALTEGVPVLHLLNVRELSRQVGMNMDSFPSKRIWQTAGLLIFFAFLITHRRWTWGETED